MSIVEPWEMHEHRRTMSKPRASEQHEKIGEQQAIQLNTESKLNPKLKYKALAGNKRMISKQSSIRKEKKSEPEIFSSLEISTMKTWRKMCKSPTMKKPPDLCHPWLRKTFLLCRHYTKGQPVCLFKKRPGSPKISNFARISFRTTSWAYQGTRQNLIVLDKKCFCMWACWIFLSCFVSSSCSVEKKY